MKRAKIVALLTISSLVALPSVSSAQSAGRTVILKSSEPVGIGAAPQSDAPATCGQFEAQIDAALKRMALEAALGERDDSAPRDQARATKRLADLTEIQIVMTQMAAAKCAPVLTRISQDKYAVEANQCSMALASVNTPKGYGLPMSCQMKNWTGQP
jgi:hypothetical protein